MSRHLCSKVLYCTFLKVTSQRYSAVSLSEVAPQTLSHDSISHWLSETKTQPQDIWQAAQATILGNTGVLIADDTVISKSRSQKMELVHQQYSGDEHGLVEGIGVLNFLWVGADDQVCPADFRIWEPQEDGKTKNNHFREMIIQAHKRGITPEAILADSWYSSLDNLKCIRDTGWSWVMRLKKNRAVNRNQRLDEVEIPEDGARLHLRGYGWIMVYRFVDTDGHTMFVGSSFTDKTASEIQALVQKRWAIEVFHRELKQTCGLGRCQARTSRAQRNHIALSILAWIKQATVRRYSDLSHYQQQWDVIKQAIADQLKMELRYT